MKSIYAFWLICSFLGLSLWVDHIYTIKKIDQKYERIEKQNQQSFDNLIENLKKIQSEIDNLVENKR